MNTSSIASKRNDQNQQYESIYRDEPNDTIEDIVKKVITHLCPYQDYPGAFEKGLCPILDERHKISPSRAVIHCWLRVVIYTNYIFTNESYKEQIARGDPNPPENLMTCFSRIYGGKKVDNGNGEFKFERVQCQRGEKCPYVIGTAMHIWTCRTFADHKYLAEGFETMSGCGFYHDDNEVDSIRQRVYNTMDMMYKDDQMKCSQIYFTRVWYAIHNINRFLTEYKTKTLATENIKFFKLNNLNEQQKMDKTNHSRIKTLVMPVFTDNNIFINNPIPQPTPKPKNQGILVQLSKFDVSNEKLFPDLYKTMETKEERYDEELVFDEKSTNESKKNNSGYGMTRPTM